MTFIFERLGNILSLVGQDCGTKRWKEDGEINLSVIIACVGTSYSKEKCLACDNDNGSACKNESGSDCNIDHCPSCENVVFLPEKWFGS